MDEIPLWDRVALLVALLLLAGTGTLFALSSAGWPDGGPQPTPNPTLTAPPVLR